jgi:hypothetical protein
MKKQISRDVQVLVRDNKRVTGKVTQAQSLNIPIMTSFEAFNFIMQEVEDGRTVKSE